MDRSSIRHGPVQTAPIFIRRLKDIRCCDGDSVVFECAVRAEPRPEIRWEKDKKPLAYTEDFRVEHVGEIVKLHISKVYPEDEGVYACIAFNDGGKASTSAALTVDAPIDRDAILQKQLKLPGSPRSGSVTPKSPTPKIPSRSISPAVLKTREKSPSTTLGTYSRLKQKRAQAPKFYAVPHNKVADEGETVRFQCAVAGHPAPYAFWDKDGERINSTPRIKVLERDDLRILEINDVNAMDAGLYRVRIENDFGGIDASARLEIISNKRRNSGGIRLTDTSSASPTFGRRLSGSAAREGSKFTFACDVQASPSPVTSWYRNGDPIESSERIVPSWDGKTARLELKQLRKGDSGVYQCIAENELGKTRCSAELVVVDSQDSSDADLKPPVFVSGLPASTHAIEGQPFELKIKLEGSEPMEVIWLKNGEEIPDCEDFRYKVYEGGSYGLLFADVFSPDSGVYSCTAYNSFGDAISTGKFIVRDEFSNGDTVEPQLQFVKSPNPVVAIAGGMATFCAKIKYMDKRLRPSLNWIVAGQDTNKNPQKFKVEEVGDTSVLHIAGVDTNDAGVVKCVATLGDDSCESLTELKVEQLEKYETPAILTQGPADISVLRGEKVVLTAAFVGRPDPFVRWLKAGRELSSDGHIEIVTKDGMSSLTISGINTDDSGKYVVSVENIHGADCHFASVAVEGSPDPPAKKPSVLANERSALITWSSPPFDGGCMITGYTIEMKTVKQRDWHVVTDRCHSLSHTVGELTPGESYIFRVRAENVHGLSEPSAESQVVQIKQTEDDLVAIYGTDTVKVENGEDFKDRFEVLEELGKGRFGIVHKVTDKTTGCKLAAKFVKCIKAKDKEKVWEEINIMNCLRHPKLLQLIAAFENSREVIMILEYISGGELFERVVADDFTLTERDCILFMRQICEGVDFMHQNCVVHLDLKPENIMCRTRTSHEIKLIDFGLARKIDPNVDERHLFGTPEFIPPEIINYEPIGVESDMWSVGVICYVLLSGLSPFMGDNDAETFANITRADFDFDDEAFDAISQDAKDFISALLVKRKEKRLTAKQCLEHKWMTQVDTEMSCVALSTDKLKKFIIRRKWQKTGNAIRALGRMANLSAASRRNSNSSASFSSSPRASLSGSGVSRMSSLSEEGDPEIKYSSESFDLKSNRMRICSERSDSGISDCSSISAPFSHSPKPLFNKDYSITEEDEGMNDKKMTVKVPKTKPVIKEPSIKESSIKPTIKESSMKASIKDFSMKPNIKESSIKPISKESSVKPSSKESSIKPSIKESSIKPSIKESSIKPSSKESSIKPSIKENKSSSNSFSNRNFLIRQSSINNNSFILKDKDLANGVVSGYKKSAGSPSDSNNNPSFPVSSAVNASKVRQTDRLKKLYEPQLPAQSKTTSPSTTAKKTVSSSTNPSFQKVVAFWKR